MGLTSSGGVTTTTARYQDGQWPRGHSITAARRITTGKDRVLGWLNIVFRRPWLRRERVAFRYV